MKGMETDFDVMIVGAGLGGLTTALACAESGAKVALFDRDTLEVGNDGRASALSASSLRLFENLGLDLTEQLQPIRDMLVTEGAPNSPWRLHFEGDGDGGDLGALVENPVLKAALIEKVLASPSIHCFRSVSVEGFEDQEDMISVQTDQGAFSASLLVAADGRNSRLRKQSGITVQRFDYDAASLVTTVSHEMSHDGLAWQRIVKGGALAVLPLTGNRSQIVWSAPSNAIMAATELDAEDFLALLSEKMDSYLGKLEMIAPRQAYPLRLQVADGFSKGRLALIGDAAHVIHPLAGQGLNLGLRDAAALADGVNAAISTGQDVGVIAVLDYDLWRNTDTRLFGLLTHVISETSNSSLSVIGHARRLGLNLTNSSSALKAAFEKRAAGDGPSLPDLMQKRY